jgi:predicted nucleic acid-binding protein
LAGRPEAISSRLASVEVLRAVKRGAAPDETEQRARAVLDRPTLAAVDDTVLDLAGRLPGPDLRSLDAIHLATALSLGDLPEAFVTYDRRLAEAARAHGLTVVQPGSSALEESAGSEQGSPGEEGAGTGGGESEGE